MRLCSHSCLSVCMCAKYLKKSYDWYLLIFCKKNACVLVTNNLAFRQDFVDYFHWSVCRSVRIGTWWSMCVLVEQRCHVFVHVFVCMSV